MNNECPCVEPGYCAEYNKLLVGRLFDICRGYDELGNEVLTQQKRNAYRAAWLKTKESANNTPLPQDVVSLAARFMAERKKWVQAGKPIRTDDRISELFTICKNCPFYNKETENNGSCGICGCRLSRIDKSLNKLAWATTDCPHHPPRWESDVKIAAPHKGVFGPASPPPPQVERSENIQSSQASTQEVDSPRQSGCGCGK